MEPGRKYRFTWDLLGDLKSGRPNLGNQTSVEVYRLMQFTFRDVAEKQFGAEKADLLFREAGKLAGTQFYDHVLGSVTHFDELVGRLQKAFKEMGIGILRLEEADSMNRSFALTISEDLDCSGLPELGYQICVYDEGFIAGLLERFFGETFKVKEEECWSTGDRMCRFVAQISV